jgi:hypothetical protein
VAQVVECLLESVRPWVQTPVLQKTNRAFLTCKWWQQNEEIDAFAFLSLFLGSQEISPWQHRKDQGSRKCKNSRKQEVAETIIAVIVTACQGNSEGGSWWAPERLLDPSGAPSQHLMRAWLRDARPGLSSSNEQQVRLQAALRRQHWAAGEAPLQSSKT